MPNLAAVAYEAYRTSLNKSATQGVYLCPWECLTEAEKKAWWAVVERLFNPDIRGSK